MTQPLRIRRILVALDASPRAPTVLAAAVSMAEHFRAKLIAVRASGIPVEFPIEAVSYAPDGLPARLLEATERGIQAAVKDVSPALLERVEARIGTPWQVICDAAREYGVELVIVGTHGHSAIDRVIGTTAARVVNHAPCSVYVVRP